MAIQFSTARRAPARAEVVAHGLTTWLATASAGELWQRPDIALELARRYSAAYQDLQTAQALAELTEST